MKMQKEQYIKIDELGDKYYFSDKYMTLLHREDGPAIEYNDGGKSWYYKGVRHRVGGPAVEFADVDGRPPQWWVSGEQVTSVSETFLQLKKIAELSLRSVRQIDKLPTPETATVLPAVRIDLLETVALADKLFSKLMDGKSEFER